MSMIEGTEQLARAGIAICNQVEIMMAAAVKHLSEKGDKDLFVRFIDSIAQAQNHLMEVCFTHKHSVMM